MQNGWIKLYRQIQNNPVFQHDFTAWHVFEVLLINADKDNGKWNGGRHQLAALCGGLNPNTTYKALLRLQNAKMVTLVSNTRYSEISICNWQKFQETVTLNGNTSSNTSSNTLTRIKNKESITNVIHVDAQRAFDLYLELFNKNPKTTKLTKARREKLRLRLKENGYNQLEAAIRNTAASKWHRGDNDRGWKADLDYIIRSTEQVERLSELAPAPHTGPVKPFSAPNNTRTLSDEERAAGRLKMAQIRKQLTDKGILR